MTLVALPALPMDVSDVADPTEPGGPTRQQRRERTDELLVRLSAATDDLARKQLRDEIVRLNLDVVDSVVSRFRGRGLSDDDLHQVASLGLVKAVRRFDPDAGHAFLSFAVPTIRGEVRRHFRDQGWTVRPPRPIQELQAAVVREEQDLTQRLGRPPSPLEIAESLDEDLALVHEAMSANGCFRPTSLDLPVGDDGSATLGDLLHGTDRDQHAVDARLIIGPAVKGLAERDREILYLRFFEGLTQREIGERYGVTQMQISRVLARILRNLRASIDGTAAAAAS